MFRCVTYEIETKRRKLLTLQMNYACVACDADPCVSRRLLRGRSSASTPLSLSFYSLLKRHKRSKRNKIEKSNSWAVSLLARMCRFGGV